MTGLIDTHCHLDKLDDLAPAFELAREAGLSGMITIGTRFSKADTQIALTQHDTPDLRIWCAIGIHPDYAGEERLPSVEELVAKTETSCVVAIGETGLDYFHSGDEAKPAQHAAFRTHIAAARQTGLPVVIHTRNADDDMIAILREEHANGAFPFLIHCFASGPKLAEAVLELGGYISFSGLLTFPKCEEIREVARMVPEDRLLVETDSPYLAPVPKRGKPNTPGYVAHTAARLAEERGVSLEEITRITTENARRLFSRIAA
ncbi:TatD family hydrolase [Gluconobacter kanchanaburiensis]|uniref:LuxR family transcriptional regulator n=1 Tax=Gluconobacter kanchanaburiensis NBRC 103587 TaxID=1307948 RepID=A0A511B682_9PROT|nr:TatD family hydrolase [Gluconobacter kanchanaburiensis]MBF0861215.1 TatD family hydrolase [Gluconobacter kanchanaburiensis]GBR70874.1 deoxyribonuclease TatD [Gluconobacter kanchanaburiensis NBRC 103587]GEK95965.1 LuxR family transcriptional regulator [Gluconobacter kanchanaburiensis NBRC 103587]